LPVQIAQAKIAILGVGLQPGHLAVGLRSLREVDGSKAGVYTCYRLIVTDQIYHRPLTRTNPTRAALNAQFRESRSVTTLLPQSTADIM
jgi:hypothetical protein